MSHTIETHVDFPILPIRRNGELATIRTHRVGHVTLVGKPTWTFSHHAVGVLVKREWICHITIQGLVPILAMMNAIDLPAGRHIYVAPSSIIIILLTHFGIHLTGVGHPIEFPCTIQRLVVRRCGHIVLCYISFFCHRNSNRMRFLTVDAGHSDIIPFFTCLGIGCSNTHQTCHHCGTTHQCAKA